MANNVLMLAHYICARYAARWGEVIHQGALPLTAVEFGRIVEIVRNHPPACVPENVDPQQLLDTAIEHSMLRVGPAEVRIALSDKDRLRAFWHVVSCWRRDANEGNAERILRQHGLPGRGSLPDDGATRYICMERPSEDTHDRYGDQVADIQLCVDRVPVDLETDMATLDFVRLMLDNLGIKHEVPIFATTYDVIIRGTAPSFQADPHAQAHATSQYASSCGISEAALMLGLERAVVS